MKDSILKELAQKWERECIEDNCQNASEDSKIPDAIAKGIRMGIRRCAADIERLISLLGGEEK